jgi:hypothetical protein
MEFLNQDHIPPEWANYVARNKDGFLYYYSHSPKPTSSGFTSGGISERVNDTCYKHENWHQSTVYFGLSK